MLTSSELKSIKEAYESIYPESIVDDSDIIDELSDSNLESVVEEVIYDLLDEGYDIDEVESLFEEDELLEEILTEATVTTGRGGRVKLSSDKSSAPVSTGSGSRMAAASRLSRMKAAQKIARQKERKEKVKATVASVKDTVKRKTNQAKGAVASAALKATGTKLKGKKGQDLTPQQTHTQHKSVRDKAKAAIKANIKGKLSAAKSGVKAKAKGAVAGAQIAGSIAKDEARRAGRKVAHSAGKAAQAVKDAPGKAASAAKRGLKGLIRRGAEKVASGATKVAKRMSEEVETYDVVVEFLCDYGIAEDLQEAQWIMVNEIDSDDIETILEAYGIDEKYQGMYQSPAPTHNRLMSSDEKARMSPGRRAMARSDELERSEPGSKRAKAQKKAAGQMARNFQSARRV